MMSMNATSRSVRGKSHSFVPVGGSESFAPFVFPQPSSTIMIRHHFKSRDGSERFFEYDGWELVAWCERWWPPSNVRFHMTSILISHHQVDVLVSLLLIVVLIILEKTTQIAKHKYPPSSLRHLVDCESALYGRHWESINQHALCCTHTK